MQFLWSKLLYDEKKIYNFLSVYLKVVPFHEFYHIFSFLMRALCKTPKTFKNSIHKTLS